MLVARIVSVVETGVVMLAETGVVSVVETRAVAATVAAFFNRDR